MSTASRDQEDIDELADLAGIDQEYAASLLEALAGSPELRFQLEALELDDVPRIELLVGGQPKPSDQLSTGQMCAVVLPLLLLESVAPLLIDQPEDNLDMGHEFEEAVSVEEARARLAAGTFDHVVLDLQLPMRKGRPDRIEYGRALLSEIVRDHPYVAVVVVTAHGKTDEHIVDVMSASPLITYVAKPFDERPGSTRLTEQIRAVLGRADSYRREGRIPGTTPPGEEQTPRPPVATIEICKSRRHRNMGWVCLVNGGDRVFSDDQYEILSAFAVAQRPRLGKPDQHSTPVSADAFGISDDHEKRHPTMSRLRTKLREFLPDYPHVLDNAGYRLYSLGINCVDSTCKRQ